MVRTNNWSPGDSGGGGSFSPRARLFSYEQVTVSQNDEPAVENPVPVNLSLPTLSSPPPPNMGYKRSPSIGGWFGSFRTTNGLLAAGDPQSLSQRYYDDDNTDWFQLKLNILMKNPAMFQRFQDRLIESGEYKSNSDGVRYVLNRFFDYELLMPHLKYEIEAASVLTQSPRRRGLLAYFKGGTVAESSAPPTNARKASRQVSVRKMQAIADEDFTLSCSSCVSLPSLESTTTHSEDDEFEEIESTLESASNGLRFHSHHVVKFH